jgi:nitrogen-specific signal transduction histidine kinase
LQRKVATLLLLIVLLPVSVMAWMGWRMAKNEQQLAAAQVQALVQAQLGTVDDGLNSYFRQLQDDWLARLHNGNLDAQALKKLPQELGLVQHVLVIGTNGKRVLPLPGVALSEAEKQFMQRTAALWDNPSLLTQGAGLALANPAARSSWAGKTYSLTTAAASTEADAAPAQSGWFTWYWNAQLHHIFWLRDAQGRLVGLELSPVALLADMVALLPSTAVSDDAAAQTLTRLVNGNGQTVYEWGSLHPGAQDKSLATRPLGHPLGTWKLEYFGSTALSSASSTSTAAAVAALLSLAVALAGLAWYLYREHSREVRLAQQRVNFVNQVSHELKTPLTNIRLYAELLEDEVGSVRDDAQSGTDKAHKYLNIITTESQRLSRLIANVLSFGQFQKAQFTLNLQPGQVDDVVLRCIAAFKPALDAKGIAVQFAPMADSAVVMLDAQALEQILNNLLSNAEKYAASGGTVHITTGQSNSSTMAVSTISVRDFGPGIAARERARIFEPFYRISSKLSDGVAGTGIGLDIARQMARQHGGDITLQDVPSGACFCVTLRTPTVEHQP